MLRLSRDSVACSPISASCRKQLELLQCQRYSAIMEQQEA